MLSNLIPLLAVLVPATDPMPQPLEREYLRVARELVKEFKKQGHGNVGVLKFQISKDGKTVSDRVGTLNLLLARRLEVALVLANDSHEPIGIINNATAVAHQTRGANHLTREGRQKLFTAKYPLAWGDQEVVPDALVTGLAQLSPDLKTLTISLFLIDRKKLTLMPVLEDFTVRNLPEHMVELGESFSTRGLFDQGEISQAGAREKEEKTVQLAAQVKQRPQTHPAANPKAAATLEVRYDGQPVRVEMRDGKAFVPEPQEHQTVELVLKRDDSQDRYGLVLKVNGQNTLEKERLPDLQCHRWILDPGDGPLTVRGYQISDKEFEKFRVLSAPESKEREIDYGTDVGTITLTVFREQKGKAKPKDPSDESREAEVVSKATLQLPPDEGKPEKPASPNALKAQLLAEANRGLIVEGQRQAGEVITVKFNPDPLPVMSLTVFYYRR